MATNTKGTPSPPDTDEAPIAPRAMSPEDRLYDRGPSPKPAMLVLGITVAILLFGIIASIAVSTGGTAAPQARSITLAGGQVVDLTPATTSLKSIVSQGQPPSDILSNLATPKGVTLTGTVNNGQLNEQYDQTASFVSGTSGLSGSELGSFFDAMFKKLGWSVVFNGQTSDPNINGHTSGRSINGEEILAKRGSNDGYYWEAGVVIPDQAAGSTAPIRSTTFTFELYQVADAD